MSLLNLHGQFGGGGEASTSAPILIVNSEAPSEVVATVSNIGTSTATSFEIDDDAKLARFYLD